MTRINLAPVVLLVAFTSAALAADQPASNDLDHSAWDSLVKQYVTPASRVEYAKWKAQDLPRLDGYLSQLAAPWPAGISAAARKAAMLNAYNALMVRWILTSYPVESVWRTDHPFTVKRHTLHGEKVSLDDIETQLRNLKDPRIHGALVCAARSCPPLRREAYRADRLDTQLDDNVRAWLDRSSLNQFFPESNTARVSKIFDWYKADFITSAGSVAHFLSKYAPASASGFLRDGKAKLEYQTYHWGLNDTSSLGEGYSQAKFLLDRAKNSL